MMNTEEELYIKVIKGEHKDNVFQVKNMSDTGMTLEISNSEISRDKVDIEDVIYETKGTECRGCSNNCEIIEVLRDKRVIDSWGNRCPKGELVHKYV